MRRHREFSRRTVLVGCTIAAGLLAIRSAAAQPNITVFEFEVDEGLSDNPFGGMISSAGLDGAGFGVTQGSSALLIEDATMQCCGLINSELSAGDTGEELNNFNAAAAAAIALEDSPGRFSFDFGYDASRVPADAFFQIGVQINSDAGFDNSFGFGSLLGGNVGPTGDFPVLGDDSNRGATMTVLDPSDFAAGDFLGLVRVSVPIGAAPDALPFGTGGDGTLDFAQFGFTVNGGWPGLVNMSLDNVGFEAVPEPTTLALAILLGIATSTVRRPR